MPAPLASYRPIVEDDIPDLFAVRIATWHNERGAEELEAMGITPESVRDRLATNHHGFVVRVEERTVGFAMGNRDNGEVWVIAVLKAYENRGFGRGLLTRVEDWLFEHGHTSIWLTTDTDERHRAVGFYRRLGWRDWKIEHGDRYMIKDRP